MRPYNRAARRLFMTRRHRALARRTRRLAHRPSAWYGWIPDLPDHRDRLYAAPLAALGRLPPRVDLRAACPPIYDQGQLGSCTANAIAAALEFDQLKQAQDDVFVPLRLFVYYNERAIEGTVAEDV